MTRAYPPSLDELRTLCASLFEAQPDILRVYVFGSVADRTAGPASDVDFGVVCRRGGTRTSYVSRGFELYADLSALLHSDRLDVVILNGSESTELRHAVITDGQIIFDRGDDLEEFERHIRHEYEDHVATLARLGIR